MNEDRLFFLHHKETRHGIYFFTIEKRNSGSQEFQYCPETRSISFENAHSFFIETLVSNSTNIIKIINSGLSSGEWNSSPLPVYFPERKYSDEEIPSDIPKIYCDGSLSNSGTGGWACTIIDGDKISSHSGSDKTTDSCRMELMAALKGIQSSSSPAVAVYTDSLYVKRGVWIWLASWEANGYITASGKPAKNSDLWKIMSLEIKSRKIYWKWIKSGGGDPYHRTCHDMAKNMALTSKDENLPKA